MDQLVGEWKKSELLREASEADAIALREQLRFVSVYLSLQIASLSSRRSRADFDSPDRAKDDELHRLQQLSVVHPPTTFTPTTTTKDGLEKMRNELERLRERNRELEETMVELRSGVGEE
jgi:hypothetical protein